jgi:hypothetical protein
VSRAPLLVRDAVEADAGDLCLLWSDLLMLPGGDGSGRPPERVAAAGITRCLGEPGCRILVAEQDGRVVGCAYLRLARVSPVHDEQAVQVSHLQSTEQSERSLVDRALLEAALSWAEQQGASTLLSATGAHDRESNRTLARLGLAQVVVLRGATVSALRGRLPHDPSALARSAARTGRSVGQVVAARRSQRRARAVGT